MSVNLAKRSGGSLVRIVLLNDVPALDTGQWEDIVKVGSMLAPTTPDHEHAPARTDDDGHRHRRRGDDDDHDPGHSNSTHETLRPQGSGAPCSSTNVQVTAVRRGLCRIHYWSGNTVYVGCSEGEFMGGEIAEFDVAFVS